MTSAIDRLRAIAEAPPPRFTAAEQRIMATTGLPVELGSAPDPDVSDLRAALAPLGDPLDIPALIGAFNSAFGKPKFSGRGYRTYRVAFELLMRPIELAAHDATLSAAALLPYEAAWQLDRGQADVAAAFALALATVAASIKAHDDGDSPDNQEAEACYARARKVLDDTRAAAAGNWLWHRADMSVAFLGCCLDIEEPDVLDATFRAVQDLDPYEFGIYEDRAGQLLPRWFGSAGALSEFASAAVTRTSRRFGSTLYARIYNAALQHATLAELDPDLNRLRIGFLDWLTRFPSQPLANRAAVVGMMHGDDALLRELFRKHIRTIHLDQWSGDNQVRKAWVLATRKHSRN